MSAKKAIGNEAEAERLMRLSNICADNFATVAEMAGVEIDVCAEMADALARASYVARLDVWALVLRLAPKTRLDALSGALYDQGFVLDFSKFGVPSEMSR